MAAEDLSKKEVRKLMAEEKLNPRRRSRGMSTSEKRAIYAEYYKRKKIVFDAESRNDRHLVLFLASDGKVPGNEKKFYHMGGNSAIIYAYDIAPMIGRFRVDLKPDFDLGDYKFKRGMVSIANLEQLTTLLEQRNIKRVERDNDDIVYFKLNKVYTKDDIQALIEMHRNEREELNKIVYSNVLFPDVHSKVLTMKTITYHKMMKISREHREILGKKLIDPVLDLSKAYSQMAHGDMEVHEAAERMMKDIDIYLDMIAMLSDLNLVEVSSLVRLGKLGVELKLLIRGKMLEYDPEKEAEKKEATKRKRGARNSPEEAEKSEAYRKKTGTEAKNN